MLSHPGSPDSVRGVECSGCRGATHDHTDSLSRKCPQGIAGVSFFFFSFNLKPSINPLTARVSVIAPFKSQ